MDLAWGRGGVVKAPTQWTSHDWQTVQSLLGSLNAKPHDWQSREVDLQRRLAAGENLDEIELWPLLAGDDEITFWLIREPIVAARERDSDERAAAVGERMYGLLTDSSATVRA